jgi:hypothetical protein
VAICCKGFCTEKGGILDQWHLVAALSDPWGEVQCAVEQSKEGCCKIPAPNGENADRNNSRSDQRTYFCLLIDWQSRLFMLACLLLPDFSSLTCIG